MAICRENSGCAQGDKPSPKVDLFFADFRLFLEDRAFGFAAFRRQLLIFAAKPQIDVFPLRFVPLSAALKTTKKKPRIVLVRWTPNILGKERKNTIKRNSNKNKEGRLNSGNSTDLRAQTEDCFVLADCRWFFTAFPSPRNRGIWEAHLKAEAHPKAWGRLELMCSKVPPPQKTLQGKWFALRKSEILSFRFSKFQNVLIPRFCRADLGWIFYFGLANSRKIASEFWWRIFLANYSALFFQCFRPSQKIHAQNSRPKCFGFSSRRVSIESNRSGPPKAFPLKAAPNFRQAQSTRIAKFDPRSGPTTASESAATRVPTRVDFLVFSPATQMGKIAR